MEKLVCCNIIVPDKGNDLPLEDRHLLKTLEVIAFELKTNEGSITVARWDYIKKYPTSIISILLLVVISILQVSEISY